MALALALVFTAAPLAAHAAPVEAEPVLYVQKGALWLLEPKAAPRQLAALPAELGAASSLQTDPAARVILVGSDLRWYWSPFRSAAGDIGAPSFRKLPCAAGRATLSPDGTAVLCATPSGAATVVQLPSLKQTVHTALLEQTALVAAPSPEAPGGTELRLVWTDARGIWTAPVATLKASRQLAPEAPRGSFSASPTGERGLGVYTGTAHHGKNVAEQDMLFGFALDGRAVRRKAIQHARPLTWSADGRWVLVQDHESACIMAATGGQYKCWKGYRGVSISRDGRFALLLGNRTEKDARDARAAKDSKASKAKNKKGGKKSKAEREKEARLAKAAKDEQDAKDKAALSLPKASIELTRLAKASSTTHTAGTPGTSGAPATKPGVSGIAGAHPTDIDTLIDSIESYEDEGDEPDTSSDGEGGEGGEGGEASADSTPSSSLAGELHLYRATLDGAFTAAPTQLAPSVDGAAAFAGPLR